MFGVHKPDEEKLILIGILINSQSTKMLKRVAKRTSEKWISFVWLKHLQEARDQDAERSTLTTSMMHLAKTRQLFLRPSGQRGTTQSAGQYDVDQQKVSP